MAFYDPDQRRLVLDIGITGEPAADCESYLQRMCQCFRTRWRNGAELRVGRDAHELEWLQIEGGLVDGIPVRCRAFVIPEGGSEMRTYLLRRCDALVFTCRADSPGIAMAARDIVRIRDTARAAGSPPVVVALLTESPELVSTDDDDLDDGDGLGVVVVGAATRSTADHRHAMTVAIRRGVRHAPDTVVAAANLDFNAPSERSRS